MKHISVKYQMALLPICCIVFFSYTSLAQITYPVARTENFDTVIYGKKISDPYFWMSRKANEQELLEFTQQQGMLTESILENIPGTEILYQDFDAAYYALQDELWNVKCVGKKIYYNRDIPGEGVWLCRRQTADAPEEKILGPVVINGVKFSVRKKVFAFNSPLVALMLTQSGEANPQIRIFNMDTKTFLPDSIGRVMFNDSRGVSMSWLPDDSGLLYTQAPPTAISNEIYYNGKIKVHIIGTDPQNDIAIFGTGINANIALTNYATPYVYTFKNSPYIIARIRAGDADNYAYAVDYTKINGAETPWKLLENYVNLGDGFDADGKYLYAATTGGAHYRVVKINMETASTPETIISDTEYPIAATDAGNSTGIIAGKDALYVLLRRIGDMLILKSEYATGKQTYITTGNAGAIGDMSLYNDNDLVFAFGSAVRSVQYLKYHYATDAIAPLSFAEKIFDASDQFGSLVLWIPSRDNKLIPVSIIYPKGIDLKNNNPLLIEAYGNSGAATDMFYNPTVIPWLKQGGIYAYAHVRGGGELGEEWMKDGQFPNKMHSIFDVVDVAEYFVTNNYTSAEKQVVMGGSAGSFLVGMSINQRPDLFAAGLFLSGLPDIVTYRDAAFARESKSVGPIDTEAGFLSSYSISSYYQIPENKKLPAMLIVHGGTDYILGLHPAVRYAAKLQQSQQGDRPILLLVDWESGHLGSEMETLYMYKFALWQTGNPNFQLK